jgi:lysophospholipase L1-like esterase
MMQNKLYMNSIGIVRLLAILVLGLVATALEAAEFVSAEFVSMKPAARIEHWQRREADIAAAMKQTQALPAIKLVFVGDSITDFWLLDDNPWVKGQKFGRKIWRESFGESAPENLALNLGISGHRTEHILHDLLPRSQGGLGELDAPELNPEFLVVMLGINNSWAAEEPVVESIFEGVRAVVVALHTRKPEARIILQSILPTNEPARNREVVLPVNERLVALAASPQFSAFTTYLDLYPGFVDPAGQQISRYFNDGLHPNEAGYRVWRDRLVPALAQMRTARLKPATGR